MPLLEAVGVALVLAERELHLTLVIVEQVHWSEQSAVRVGSPAASRRRQHAARTAEDLGARVATTDLRRPSKYKEEEEEEPRMRSAGAACALREGSACVRARGTGSAGASFF
eukprot:7386702-Prymnesium_polylepis.1